MREPVAWVLDGYGVRSTCGRYRLVQERRRKPWRLLVDGKEKKGTYATLWDAFDCIESDREHRDSFDIDWLQIKHPELKGLANEVLVKVAPPSQTRHGEAIVIAPLLGTKRHWLIAWVHMDLVDDDNNEGGVTMSENVNDFAFVMEG